MSTYPFIYHSKMPHQLFVIQFARTKRHSRMSNYTERWADRRVILSFTKKNLSFAMHSRAMYHFVGPSCLLLHHLKLFPAPHCHTIPYTLFAMKKHEVPKSIKPAVTVARISSSSSNTNDLTYLTKTNRGSRHPAQAPTRSFPTCQSQCSWAIRLYRERSISPKRRQSVPAARSFEC